MSDKHEQMSDQGIQFGDLIEELQRLFEACDFCQVELRTFACDHNNCIATIKKGNDFIKLTFETELRVDKLIDYINQEIHLQFYLGRLYLSGKIV